tara:strand:+ start:1456 stop:1638 length:183 start_codon:yes stop_codon:yes gene_type:complete
MAKIDKHGLEEIRLMIETPLQGLAEQLDEKNKLDSNIGDILAFLFDNLQKIGEDPWEIVD